jgi:glycosyltransferase 2 family protein
VKRIDVRALAERLRRLVAPATLAAVAIVVWSQRHAVAAFPWRLSWPTLVLAALLFSVPPLLGATAFWVILRGLAPAAFAPSVRVWMRSFVARFIPGGVVTLAVRLDGCRRIGVSPRQMISATAYELVAAAFGGATAALFALSLRGHRPPTVALALGGGVLAATVGAAIAVPRLSGSRFARALPRLVAVPRRALAGAALIATASWLPAGAAAWILTEGLSTSSPGILFVAGSYALAWLCGFIVVFAPGGLGVREATLVALLGPRFGLGPAAVLALMLRFANVLGDLIAVGATEAVALARGRRRSDSGGDGLARRGRRDDASVHRFDRVAVGVDHAGGVVLPAVLGADAWEPLRPAARLDRGRVEGVHDSGTVGRERELERPRGPRLDDPQ